MKSSQGWTMLMWMRCQRQSLLSIPLRPKRIVQASRALCLWVSSILGRLNHKRSWMKRALRTRSRKIRRRVHWSPSESSKKSIRRTKSRGSKVRRKSLGRYGRRGSRGWIKRKSGKRRSRPRIKLIARMILLRRLRTRRMPLKIRKMQKNRKRCLRTRKVLKNRKKRRLLINNSSKLRSLKGKFKNR